MLLTEDEARTRECRVSGMHATTPPVPWTPWPPISVHGVVAPDGVGTMPVELPSFFPLCAASACMHWRWGEPLYEDRPVNEGAPVDGNGWKRAWAADPTSVTGKHVWRRVVAQRGYCGMAGRP